MVPSHPFNEMKPNSGSTRLELLLFHIHENVQCESSFQQNRALAINKARMIARLVSRSGTSHFTHEDFGASQPG
jgi:hypothetical protein